MDTKKVIVTLLVLTIILSVLTVAFSLSGGKTLFIDQRRGGDQANVGLHVEGGTPAIITGANDNANVGLYVSS